MFSLEIINPTITVIAETGDFGRAPLCPIDIIRRAKNQRHKPKSGEGYLRRVQIGGPAARPIALHARKRRESNNQLVRANKPSELVTAITRCSHHNSCGGAWRADVRLVLEAGMFSDRNFLWYLGSSHANVIGVGTAISAHMALWPCTQAMTLRMVIIAHPAPGRSKAPAPCFGR
jgi:hypothetical protein